MCPEERKVLVGKAEEEYLWFCKKGFDDFLADLKELLDGMSAEQRVGAEAMLTYINSQNHRIRELESEIAYESWVKGWDEARKADSVFPFVRHRERELLNKAEMHMSGRANGAKKWLDESWDNIESSSSWIDRLP